MGREFLEARHESIAQADIVEALVGQRLRIGRAQGFALVDLAQCLPASLDCIQDPETSNAEQPRTQRTTTERPQIAKRLDEHLLLYILAQCRIPEDIATVAIDGGAVALHQESHGTCEIELLNKMEN